MLIDCDRCAMRNLLCTDCVVTVVLDASPGQVVVDESERLALQTLAESGLVPRLRLVPLGIPGLARPSVAAS